MKNKILTIIAAFGINWIWVAVWVALVGFISKTSWNVQMFFYSCIVAPFIEEFIFRVGLLGWTRNYPDLRHSMVIVSSAVFGYLHGGFDQIFIQGVAGYIIGTVYIKNDYCYGSAVLLHFLWNAILLIS